jgi:adenylate cyclase
VLAEEQAAGTEVHYVAGCPPERQGSGANKAGSATCGGLHAAPVAASSAFRLPGNGALAPYWPRGTGYVEVTRDLDGVVHSLVPRKIMGGVAVDSLALAVVRAVDPGAARRYAAGAPVVLDYAGPPGSFDAPGDPNLDIVVNGLLDPRSVAGKIVLIGATAPDLKDLFPGPYDAGAALTPGIEVHANAVRTLLRDQPLQPVPAPLNAVVLLGAGLVVLTATARLRPLFSVVVALASAAGVAAQVLFAGTRVWLDVVGPLVAVGSVYVVVQTARVVESLGELRRVQRIFGRYVSPAVVRELLSHPEALRLGGRRREISVLFSDIRGFTTLSEQLAPEKVSALLNEYFTAMVTVIFDHGGTVDKFVGDAIMALFNAPLDQPDHAQRAVETALAMQAATDVLADRWKAQGDPELRIGVGVHSGPAVVGNMGAEQRAEYTVIGDTVNVASRLESLSKDLGCSIVISAETARRLATTEPFQPLGPLPIKGRAAPMVLYGVRRTTGSAEAAPAMAPHSHPLAASSSAEV